MSDVAKALRPKRMVAPKGVKLLFLALPLVFVAYGMNVLQEFLIFYNNSVQVTARVVHEPVARELPSRDAASKLMEIPGHWPQPAFLYLHENGVYYIAKPIVDASRWRYHHGELVDVRYNRLNPLSAQPVTLFRFWWTPGLFLVGGALSFLALLLVFYQVENPHARISLKRLFKRKQRPLNLRRR